MKIQQLYNKEHSKAFYEIRYEKGYMDEWPDEQKQRVFEIVRNLNLGKTGVALDFGCGNGVFTELLRQALPEWKIYGCDISEQAIENARHRFPECSFFIADENEVSSLKFDFLFSHHVLEHVFDIEKIVNQISNLLRPDDASALLILPCGNEGSFEYQVSKYNRNGIDPDQENRFFFEDEGHIRRLNTEQLSRLMKIWQFNLERDFYSNQYYGAIKWISQSTVQFILSFANPEMAVNKSGFWFLFNLRLKLLILFFVQLPSTIYFKLKLKRFKTISHHILGIIIILPHLISYPVYAWVNFKARAEWIKSRSKKNGSEMYLFFRRGKSSSPTTGIR